MTLNSVSALILRHFTEFDSFACRLRHNQSINQSKALISVGQNVTDYSVRGKIKTVRISNSIISINVSEQLSNNKIAVISFCCKYKVMSPGAKSVAVADGFREEMMKHVMRSVPHCVEQCFLRQQHRQVAEQWDHLYHRSQA